MKKGICTIATIAVRISPSHSSEMVTQLLFGEQYTVLEEITQWIKIVNKYDDYEGWIPTNQFTISDKAYDEALHCFSQRVFSNASLKEDESIIIPAASILPINKSGEIQICGNIIHYDAPLFNPEKQQIKKEDIAENAKVFLGSPYLWGGKTFMGIDCSGLVQNAFRMSGIFLPRDSGQQASMGETINLIHEAESGDIAFFDNEEGMINHTGIIIEDQQIIHSSGLVRIDHLDQQGIFNKSTQKYTHKLRMIKKIL
ncbi:NlpC/P60 family protein [Bacteroidota bacterium]